MPSQPFRIALACDVDPEPPIGPGPRIKETDGDWRGVTNLLPRLLDHLDRLESRTGRHLPIGWFFRADTQMAELHGDAAWALKEVEPLVDRLKARGDEIAWHPHFWRWSEERRTWHQEWSDEDWMVECLRTGFLAFREVAGHIPSARMGWGCHTSATMSALDALGIRRDLSAVPGMYCSGLDRGGAVMNVYDWRGTPDQPYHPSRDDYRVPGERALRLLEIPASAGPDPFPHSIGSALARRTWPPPRFHFTPVKDPRKTQPLVTGRARRGKTHALLYFHPYDLVADRIDMFIENARRWTTMDEVAGRAIELVRPDGIAF